MAIPRSLIALWLLLAGIIAYAWWAQERAYNRLHPAVPRTITQITVITPDHETRWQYRENRWQINGKTANAARVADWQKALARCQGNYAPEAIAPTPDPFPVTLILNQERYQFGAANTFAQSNYLTYNNRVYLCEDSLKASLMLPPDFWLEKPDA